MYSCTGTHWLRPRNPLPRIWAHIRGRYWSLMVSLDMRHLFITPWKQAFNGAFLIVDPSPDRHSTCANSKLLSSLWKKINLKRSKLSVLTPRSTRFFYSYQVQCQYRLVECSRRARIFSDLDLEVLRKFLSLFSDPRFLFPDPVVKNLKLDSEAQTNTVVDFVLPVKMRFMFWASREEDFKWTLKIKLMWSPAE